MDKKNLLVILIVLLVFVAPEVLTDMGGTAGSGT